MMFFTDAENRHQQQLMTELNAQQQPWDLIPGERVVEKFVDGHWEKAGALELGEEHLLRTRGGRRA